MHVSPDSTVIELSGPDRAGKLAEVTKLLMNNGCNVRSAAVRHTCMLHCCALPFTFSRSFCMLSKSIPQAGMALKTWRRGAGVDIQGKSGICAQCPGEG